MWETAFEVSMFDGEDTRVIISCPSEELSVELIELLSEHGISWGNKQIWHVHKEDTCFRIGGKHMGYGSKPFYESNVGTFFGYTYCTFHGISTPDFDIATDDELRSLLCI